MKISEEDKKEVVKTILEVVAVFTRQDKRPNALPPSLVIDLPKLFYLFFDYADYLVKNYREFGLTEHQYQIFKKFYDSLESTSNEYDNSKQVSAQKWEELSQLAIGVVEVFKHRKSGVPLQIELIRERLERIFKNKLD